MIIRIFRACIKIGLEDEFEEKYRTVSVPFMESCQGMESVSIGRPTQWTPDDYVMVSEWTSLQALQDALGSAWHEAHIPAGMEHLIASCAVEHFERM
ncbi:hypothetical protein HFP57_05750 [Parasphingopyxis algicola]|uniref:antibiotic biosynthesis monooxygenase family protein n=1 Tax=Parasphingopyxis algicola TaxID=2026624 RepID=UPI00159FDA19|nr:antibiotic biosynthesis monooxygenase [Parasphingopyxis algicola]QLC24579.1 hypothetical protein HFP57_05750 [Parasphingopyxis algicola]